MNIQWYPGHMAKMKRTLQQQLKFVDVIAEVLDARAPLATHNADLTALFQGRSRVVLLTKQDIAQADVTQQWLDYFQQSGIAAIGLDARSNAQRAPVLKLLERAAQQKIQQYQQKGIKKTVRVMVVGIPNCGKSTLINSLCGNVRAKVGNQPGVTRATQWVKISPYLELMDTPGMLWPKLDDEAAALYLAYIHAIRDEIMEVDELAVHLLQELCIIAPAALRERYNLDDLSKSGAALLFDVAKNKGFLLQGGIPDEMRAARTVLNDFRGAKLGRISLERP